MRKYTSIVLLSLALVMSGCKKEPYNSGVVRIVTQIEPQDSMFEFREYSAPDSWPKTVHTSCGDYAIKYTADEDLFRVKALAETKFDMKQIWIPYNRSKSSPYGQSELLLHELIHVSLHCAGGPESEFAEDGEDEQFIHPVAPQLLDILKKNPEVSKWIQTQ